MSNWKRWLFAADVHGSEQDPGANRAFWKFVETYKPQIRVMGGDLWDFAALRAKADEEERRISMKADFEAGLEWLLRYRPQHFLRGNHDERLWRLAARNRGPLSDYATTLIGCVDGELRKMKTTMLPYDKRHGIVRIGNLKCLHGYATGIGAARRTATVYGACVFGHGHSPQIASIEGLEDRVGRQSGCLCKLDLEYAQHQLGALLWRHGWVYGIVNEKTGNYRALSAESIDGDWMVSTNFEGL